MIKLSEKRYVSARKLNSYETIKKHERLFFISKTGFGEKCYDFVKHYKINSYNSIMSTYNIFNIYIIVIHTQIQTIKFISDSYFFN